MEKKRKSLWLLSLVIVMLLVCVTGTMATGNLVTDIQFQSAGSHEEITIFTEREVSVTSKYVGNPDRIVIEASDLSPGIFDKEILLEGQLVSRLIPQQAQGSEAPTTNYELVLNRPAGYAVVTRDNKVVITVDPSIALNSAAAVEPAPLAASSAERPLIVAQSVQDEPPQLSKVVVDPAPSAKEDPIALASVIREAAAPIIIAPVEKTKTTPTAEKTDADTSPGTIVATLDANTVLGMKKPDRYTGKPITLDFKDMDIRDVFIMIANVSGFNIVLDPDVKGSITIRLDNVPWDQALDVILRNQSLDKEIDGNVMRIANMNKLKDERILRKQMEEAQEKVQATETRIAYLSYAKAKEVSTLSKKMLSGRGEIITDDRTNSLIIIDLPEAIDRVVKLIRILDVRTKQIFINAQLVTTSKDFSRNLGIQWGGRFIADAAHGNSTGYSFPNNYKVGFEGGTDGGYAVNLPGGTQLLDLSFGNVLNTLKLQMALSASESEGITKIISNPRITTSDNVGANIESGTQLPFASVSAEGTQTQLVSATLKLDVTPHVTHEGYISMEVLTTKNSPDYSNRSAAGVPILVNSAKTQVLIKDGETLVIGGLNESTFGDAQTRIPFLSQIPVLGWLFKNSLKNSKFTDLLIFVTPQVVQWGEQATLTGQF